MKKINVGNNRFIGDKEKCFIVAEISANHGRSFKRAAALIKKAKECGADAVKFQTYTPDTLTIDVDNRYFRIRHPEWGGQTLYKLYKKAYMPWRWLKGLKKIADDTGIVFFSTAFDRTSVDLLEEIGVPLHKISSFEIADLPLIEYAAKTGKPLILSTGMAKIFEIREAIDAAAGADGIILLKCTSSYPSKPEDMNLKTIPRMARMFKRPVGLSDHTMGIGASIAAVGLGAAVIEKHMTLSRKLKTPDSFFSMEPEEMKDLVNGIRIAEKAMGVINFGLNHKERKMRIFGRSLFVTKDIKKGDFFTSENVRSIRPAYGLRPKLLGEVLGKRASRDIGRGTPLKRSLMRP